MEVDGAFRKELDQVIRSLGKFAWVEEMQDKLQKVYITIPII